MQKSVLPVLRVFLGTVLLILLGTSVGFTQEINGAESSGNVMDPTAVPPVFNRTYSLDQLKEDFIQLKQQIMTANPLIFADKTELEKAFETEFSQLRDGLSELDFYRILTPVVSKVRCGHTYLQPSKEYEEYLAKEGKFLPLEIKIYNNQAFICRNLSPVLIPTGSEVVSINGKPVKEIISIFLNNLPADGTNLTRKYYLINLNFSLYYYRFIDNPAEFRITYINPQDRRTSEMIIPALTKAQQLQILMSTPAEGAPVVTPFYSQQIEHNYAVLTIKSFAFYENHTVGHFRTFIDHFFKELAAKKVNYLILDLRGNEGGNPFCIAQLFSYLISAPTPYFSQDTEQSELTLPILPAKNGFKGKLYVLINGGTFSATAQLVSLLKYHKIGILVGEETGGAFTFTDNSTHLILANTKLRLQCPRREIKAAVFGFIPGRGIFPDIEVHPTLADFLSGRDSEKIFVVGQIMRETSVK